MKRRRFGKKDCGVFAEFIEGLEIDALSGEVLDRAELSVLDFVEVVHEGC